MARGNGNRCVGATRSNAASSRSHLVLTLCSEMVLGGADDAAGGCAGSADGVAAHGHAHVHATSVSSTPPQPSSSSTGGALGRLTLLGKLHLVDLAGSERVKLSGAAGVRLAEVRAGGTYMPMGRAAEEERKGQGGITFFSFRHAMVLSLRHYV